MIGKDTNSDLTGIPNGQEYQGRVAAVSAPLPEDRREYTRAVTATPNAP